MKKYVVFLCLIAMSSAMATIAQNCRGIMDPRTFSMNLQQIRVMATEDLRFQRAMNTVQSVCLSSTQVFELGILFSSDDLKYDLVAAAYLNLTDQQNAYLLLDVFTTFSSAFRFHDYMNFIDKQRNRPTISPRLPGNIPQSEPTPVPRPTPPTCVVTDNDMREIRQAIQSESVTRGMVEQGKLVIKAKNCLTAEQIASLLPLFSITTAQLEIAKFAFDYCIDRNNYFKVVNVLGTTSSKDDLRRFIESRN